MKRAAAGARAGGGGGAGAAPAPRLGSSIFGTSDGQGTVTSAKLAQVPAALIARHVAGGPRDNAAWYTGPAPTRPGGPGTSFVYADAPTFRPNVSPEDVLRAGAFGGTYFRDIASCVTGLVHVDAWRELPPAWLAGVNVARLVASPRYDTAVNVFRVKSGTDLRAWESTSWITEQDPCAWRQAAMGCCVGACERDHLTNPPISRVVPMVHALSSRPPLA